LLEKTNSLQKFLLLHLYFEKIKIILTNYKKHIKLPNYIVIIIVILVLFLTVISSFVSSNINFDWNWRCSNSSLLMEY